MEDHMKTAQLCAATLLSLVLAVSAFAGHVDSPPVVEPTPAPTTTATGISECPGVTSTDTSSATTDVIVAIVSLTY